MKRYAMPIVNGRLAAPVEAERGYWMAYTDHNILLTHARESWREVQKLAAALLEDTLEPDKVYILAGRIKAQADRVLKETP